MAFAGVTHEFSMAIIVAHLSFTTAGEIIAQRKSRTFDQAIKHAIALAQSSYTGSYAKNNPCG